VRQPKSLHNERLNQPWDSETFSKYFPDTNEITFFDDILNAYDNGKTGREIIREVFKCSRSDGGIDSIKHELHDVKDIILYRN
jgi:hypothetical protein